MSEWTPARPDRGADPQRDGSAPGRSMGVQDALAPPHAQRPAPVRRPALWSRLGAARRILVGFVILGLVLAVVTAAGATSTPRYGSLAPLGTDAVVDVRAVPTVEGWSTDLARAIVPGVPVRCVTFQVSSPTGRLVLVHGQAGPLGGAPSCTTASRRQVASTVALLDTETGRVRWSTDLRTSFPPAGGSISIGQTIVVPSADRALVQFTVDNVYTLASIDLGTGDVVGRTQVGPDEVGQGLRVQGTLALYNGTTSREGSSVWTLVDVRRLAQTIWTRQLTNENGPILLDHSLFATLDGKPYRIDGATGALTRLGDDASTLTNSVVDDDVAFVSRAISSGTVVSAWSDSGHRMWARSGVGEITGLTRDCLITTLLGTSELTCLDRTTGEKRWTSSIDSQSYAYYITGQTSNDVPVFRSFGEQSELLMLDGDTGREMYHVALRPSGGVVAASRTTGYIEVASESGSDTGLSAFDMATGRVLWRSGADVHGDLQLWGGHIVRLSKDSVATEMTDPPSVVLGD